MKRIGIFSVFLLLIFSAKSATVDTVEIYSNSMHHTIKAVIIKPNGYQSNTSKRYPVIYLLHGAFQNYSNWIKYVPHIQQLADQCQLLIVCPDGGFNSWYFDSPIDSTYRYETFVAKEVPEFIDGAYHTIANRNGRAITGLSMGGHGGLFLAFRHSETFSACGSTSGALMVSIITKGYDVEKRLGDTTINRKYWQEWNV